ncbi:DUF2357 domain-containing protein [Marinomonas sp. ef1]|uniref:DUF2357 domain-containing protein n=1 Tax=Marinomonas sp. ef1 TaxID=2005043 RepID=UPI000C2896C6|nr:DUF2357 domain-containing protein [Marinomonas sp. ef1]
MKLTLEIISGMNRGKEIVLSPQAKTIHRPYLTETDAVEIYVELDSPQSEVTIVIEDAKIELEQIDEKGLYFFAKPKKKKTGYFGYDALFYNYFGIAILYVEVISENGTQILLAGEVEVLARKVTSEQVKNMVRYILESGNIDLLRAQGATRRGVNITDDESLPPQRLIEHLEKVIDLFEYSMPLLVRSPLSSLASQLEVIPLRRDIEIQDQGIAWLAENLSVLTPADEPDNYLINYNGQGYTAHEMQTAVVRENTDIYENRVIHGFIESLLIYTHNLKGELSYHTPPVSLNKVDGYESFFNVMGEWLRTESNSNIRKVNNLQERIKKLLAILQKRIPVKESIFTLPKFTPKVRSSKLYSSIYKEIYKWHAHASIDWTLEKILMAINSVPKLFEIYSVLLVSGWAKERLKINKKEESFLSGNFHNIKFNIKYEPIYWITHHTKANENEIVRTEVLTTYDSYQNQYNPTKVRTGKNSKRSPDIVMELFDVSTNTPKIIGLIVLDAKYTNREFAFERDLPTCTMKYVHGLSSKNTPDLVKALIILYPDAESPWLDFHASSYGLYGHNPQRPILGAQGLDISGSNYTSTIYKTLDLVIEKISG